MTNRAMNNELIAETSDCSVGSHREMAFVYFLLLITSFIAVIVPEANWSAFLELESMQCLSIILASFKIFLIAEYFMELRHAPAWLRGLMITWVGMVMFALIGVLAV